MLKSNDTSSNSADRMRRAHAAQPYHLPRMLLCALLSMVFVFHSAAGNKAAALLPAAPAAIQLPAGFVNEPVVSGLLAPRAFDWTPDGRMLILERGSATSEDINFASVRVFKNGLLLPARALTLNVCGDGERGALGLAIDPGFATNGYIYIYYTRQSGVSSSCGYQTYIQSIAGPRNRVARFTMNGDSIDSASEKVLIDSIATDVGVHNAGNLAFDSTGFLYISTGDGGISTLSPLTSTLNGKILRIKPDDSTRGFSTAANPFDAVPGARYCATALPDNSSSPCREVYAYGLRNPFRFTLNTGNNDVFIGDVGGGTWEEINQLRPGGNYGYPSIEGMCSCDTSVDPIYAYSHVVVNANSDSAISAIGYYRGAQFPPGYFGQIYFADFLQPWMRRLRYDSVSGTWIMEPFMTGLSGIIDIKQGPDGNLYYLTTLQDSLPENYVGRIRYAGSGNRQPVASIVAAPLFPAPNAPVVYSGTLSYDPDNDPLIYKWELADGSVISSTAAVVTTTYPVGGSKTVTLTVIDKGSPALASLPVSITVYPDTVAPTASIVLTNITSPGRQSFYAGDSWAFGATNVSAQSGLAAMPYSWSVEFHHRDHAHPFLSGMGDQAGQFSTPRTGETDTVVWYRVTLRLTDAQGATNIISRDVFPLTTTIGLATLPSGGQIQVNGQTLIAPNSIARVVGMQDQIDLNATQVISSQFYTFAGWSNSGPKSQAFTAPATPITLTATLVLSASLRTYLPAVTKHLAARAASYATRQCAQEFDRLSLSCALGCGHEPSYCRTPGRFPYARARARS